MSQPTVSKYRKEVESSYKDYKIESSRKVKRGDQEYTVDSTLLNDEEWSGWSDREIARKCEVSTPTVSKYRESICKTFTDEPTTRKVKRGDQEYTVNTSNIGSKRKLLDDPTDYAVENDNGYDLPDNVDPEFPF